MTAETYVATGDIKAVLRGRETELIEALGVDWRAGRPHINCPYLDHTDRNPSWRSDERHAKAHCTCGEQDALGVVGKVLGVDFEAAKIRSAELLKRDDLIREKYATRGQ